MRRTPIVLGQLGVGLGALTALMSAGGLVFQSVAGDFFGGLGRLLGGLPRRRGEPNPEAMLERAAAAMEGLRPYQYALSGGLLAFSLVLVVVGIGLWGRRGWARTAGIGWALAALAFLPVMVWLQAFVIAPQTQAAVYSAMPVPPGQQGLMQSMRLFQTVAAAVGMVTFYAPYPAILLGLLARKSARQDFPQAAPPRG